MTEPRLRTALCVGFILLIIGLAVWLIPLVPLGTITGEIDNLISKTSLSQSEQQMLNDFQGSKIWWETQRATILNPLAIVLVAIGVILILYGVITKYRWETKLLFGMGLLIIMFSVYNMVTINWKPILEVSESLFWHIFWSNLVFCSIGITEMVVVYLLDERK